MSFYDNVTPQANFQMRTRDESIGGDNPYRWESASSESIFVGKRVIVLALPRAFTPTCSSTHVPRFDQLYETFRTEGIDEIYCLSVNDAFVMNQWGRHIGIKNIKLLPDGNGEFTRKMGMLVDKKNVGFGPRSWRYSMVVNDGMIEQMFIEDGFEDNCESDPFEVSDADTLLAWLLSKDAPNRKPDRNVFVG
jgi:peroxiredoxin